MHMNTPEQNLLERYQKLPQVLKDAIFAEATADKVFNIGKQRGLTIDKIGEMAKEIGYVMLGITKPNEFVGNLQKALGVSKNDARAITADTNKEIFYPIREHLRGLHNDRSAFGEHWVEPPSPAVIFEEKVKEIQREPVTTINIGSTTSTPAPTTNKPSQTSFAELRRELEEELMREHKASPQKPAVSEVQPLTLKAYAPPRQVFKGDLYRETANGTPQARSLKPKTLGNADVWKFNAQKPESSPEVKLPRTQPSKVLGVEPAQVTQAQGFKPSAPFNISSPQQQPPLEDITTSQVVTFDKSRAEKSGESPTPIQKEVWPSTGTAEVSTSGNGMLPKFRGYKIGTAPDTELHNTVPAQTPFSTTPHIPGSPEPQSMPLRRDTSSSSALPFSTQSPTPASAARESRIKNQELSQNINRNLETKNLEPGIAHGNVAMPSSQARPAASLEQLRSALDNIRKGENLKAQNLKLEAPNPPLSPAASTQPQPPTPQAQPKASTPQTSEQRQRGLDAYREPIT